MAAETKVKSQTKFPTMHSLSAKTHGNSNDYRQLKSIATAIRNSRSSPATSDHGSVNQPTIIELDNQRWSPAINDEYTSTPHDNSQIGLLTGYP